MFNGRGALVWTAQCGFHIAAETCSLPIDLGCGHSAHHAFCSFPQSCALQCFLQTIVGVRMVPLRAEVSHNRRTCKRVGAEVQRDFRRCATSVNFLSRPRKRRRKGSLRESRMAVARDQTVGVRPIVERCPRGVRWMFVSLSG